MGVDRVNRAGLLGDSNLLRGDTSGGYSVRIHQLDSQPIIETLGLLVDSWSDGDGDTPGAIATFKPVLPSWLDVDLYYGKGNLICSRAHGSMTSPAGYWLDEEKNKSVTTDASTAASPPYYNNALGAATQPITGPFHFPDVTVQVYPLLADRDKLKEVLDNFLNNPLSEMISPSGQPQNGWRFESFGSYVYMMVTVYGDEFGQTWSGTNNIGDFFDREVTFCIPVKWYDEKGELISVAVIEPFTFSNNDRAVATDREVNGYNTIKATIESPHDIWLEPNGPAARRRLLEMQIEVIPALNLGQKAEQRPLLEIDEQHAPAPDDEAGWRNVADTWGRDLIGDLKRKTYFAADQAEKRGRAGKALALELLAYRRLGQQDHPEAVSRRGATDPRLLPGPGPCFEHYHVGLRHPRDLTPRQRPPLPAARQFDRRGPGLESQVPAIRRWRGYRRAPARPPVLDASGPQGGSGHGRLLPGEGRARADRSSLVRNGRGDGGDRDGQTPYFHRQGSTRVGGPARVGQHDPREAHREALHDLLDQKKLDAWFGQRTVQRIHGGDPAPNAKNQRSDQGCGDRSATSWRDPPGLRGGRAGPEREVHLIDSVRALAMDPGVGAVGVALAPGSLHGFCEMRSVRELQGINAAFESLAAPWDCRLPSDPTGPGAHDEPASSVRFADGRPSRTPTSTRTSSLWRPAWAPCWNPDDGQRGQWRALPGDGRHAQQSDHRGQPDEFVQPDPRPAGAARRPCYCCSPERLKVLADLAVYVSDLADGDGDPRSPPR